MPRKAPDKVIEHRISLSNYERKEFQQYLDAQKTAAYLQPFAGAIGPVAGVAAIGGIGYLVAAYLFDWWPFEGPDYATGFAFTDRFFYEAYENLSSDEVIAEKRDEELAALDRSKEMSEKVLANEETLSKSVFGRIQIQAATKFIANYPKARQKIIDKWIRIQNKFAESAAAIQEGSDAV